MKKKTLNKQHLSKAAVIIQDTTEHSPNYFNIAGIQDYFSGGINSFRISMNNNNLVKDSRIYVEILDSFDNPIYYESLPIVDDSNMRIISVYVYDDTPHGRGLLCIVGTAKKDKDGNDISNQINNVRWCKKIDIKPKEKNNSPIIFKNEPVVEITELFKPITSGSSPVSGSYITISGSNMDYYIVGNNPIVETPDTSYEFNNNMIEMDITFQINGEICHTEPVLPNTETYSFTTKIKDVLSSHKIVLKNPIIIYTERNIQSDEFIGGEF